MIVSRVVIAWGTVESSTRSSESTKALPFWISERERKSCFSLPTGRRKKEYSGLDASGKDWWRSNEKKKREEILRGPFSLSPLLSCMYIRDEKSPDGAALFPRQAPAVSATTARTIGPDELPNRKISFFFLFPKRNRIHSSSSLIHVSYIVGTDGWWRTILILYESNSIYNYDDTIPIKLVFAHPLIEMWKLFTRQDTLTAPLFKM